MESSLIVYITHKHLLFSEVRNRPRRFYPGGDIIDYFRPVNSDGLNIQWDTVTNKDYLLYLLEGDFNSCDTVKMHRF